MTIYARIALVCFTMCLFAGWVLLANVVPWISVQIQVKTAFACLAAIYFPLSFGILAQIHRRQSVWSNSLARIIGASILGIASGLFASAMLALFGHRDLDWDKVARFDRLLYGGQSPSLLEQLRDLWTQAELLYMFKRFVESVSSITLTAGVLTTMMIALLDTLQRRREDKQKQNVNTASSDERESG